MDYSLSSVKKWECLEILISRYEQVDSYTELLTFSL